MNISQSSSAIPDNYPNACRTFQKALKHREKLHLLSKQEFIQGWHSLFYIAPGLHPDEWDNPDGGWPIGWKSFASEAFRRASLSELSDEELYPCEAQHAALSAA